LHRVSVCLRSLYRVTFTQSLFYAYTCNPCLTPGRLAIVNSAVRLSQSQEFHFYCVDTQTGFGVLRFLDISHSGNISCRLCFVKSVLYLGSAAPAIVGPQRFPRAANEWKNCLEYMFFFKFRRYNSAALRAMGHERKRAKVLRSH